MELIWLLLAALGIIAGLCTYIVSNARSIKKLNERLRDLKKKTDR